MGIKFSENTFSSHRLDILSLNGTQIADNPNETTFQKPISVILGDADEIGEATLNTISILNLNATHSESIATAKVEDGQLAFEVLSTGRLFLAQNEALHQHAVDIFQAIEDGKSKEVNDLVKTAHRSGSTTISINSDNLCPGDLVRSKLYTNCNCGSTRWRRYQAGTNIWSNVHIQFPSGTSNRKRRKAYYALYDYFNTGYGRIRVNYYVKVLKCSQVRVKTREIIRKSEGSICGFPFSYEALHGLLTTAQLEDCPITSQCHQGCSH
ncbi:MAG: hypothetical protein AB8G22_13095 [Saprospiraceae bacterium]